MAARPRTLPAAVAPVLVGTAAAVYAVGELPRVGGFIVAMLGSILIQIGTNLANDYSDAKRGADTADRLGPVRVTSAGLVTPRRVLVATYVAFALAVACGIYLTVLAGPLILVIGALSIAAGVLYTGGPRPYGYAGLGEVFVFLFFGLVAVNGSYYVQLEELDALPFGLSVAVGLLATAILVVNNLRDIETDRRAGEEHAGGADRARGHPGALRGDDVRRLRGARSHPAARGRPLGGGARSARPPARPPPAPGRAHPHRRARAERGARRDRRPARPLQPPGRRRPADRELIVGRISAEVIPYALEFRDPYVTSRGTLAEREIVLLRLRDAEGVTGLGEAVPLSLRGRRLAA